MCALLTLLPDRFQVTGDTVGEHLTCFADTSCRPHLNMSQQLQAQSEKLLAGPKRLRRQAETWISQQPPYIEVAVATLLGGGQGAFLGTVMGTMTKLDPNAGKMFNPPPGANPEMAQRMSAIQAGGPMSQAKNFAVMTGVNAGLSLAVKRYRGGVEDVRGV